jgi:DNA modification methylase
LGTVKEKYGYLPVSCREWENVPDKWKLIDKRLKINLKRRSDTCKHLPGLKFSKFSYGLSEDVIRYWSEKGDKILDPFMGWGIRGAVSINLDREYIGYDISEDMYGVATDFLKKITNSSLSTYVYKTYLKDGIELQFTKDESVDLIFTCPPYHDREKYPGDNIEQLSKIKTYKEFLDKIDISLNNCYRVLKPEKFCIWVVGDWRNNGLYLFHRDVINLAEKNGFKTWDIMIAKLRSPFAFKQVGKCDKMKYTSKNHEYVLVFKK